MSTFYHNYYTIINSTFFRFNVNIFLIYRTPVTETDPLNEMQKKREEMRAWSDSEASKSETSKAEGEKETKSSTKVVPL